MSMYISWCLRLISYCSIVLFLLFCWLALLQPYETYKTDAVDASFSIQSEPAGTTGANDLIREIVVPKVNTICAEAGQVYLMIIINSAPQNFYLRWTIRKTWGALRRYKGKNVRLAFVVGRPAQEEWRLKNLLARENKETNDVIMGDFVDSYYNLTAKTLHGMSWVRTYCSNANFIVKGDDDVLIVPQTVIDYLDQLPTEQSEMLYEGACQIDHQPMRGENNKWFISEKDYPNATYPPYQLGVTVLHSYQALDALYSACYKVPSQLDVPINFPFDDVFIGICAQLTSVPVTCNNHIIVYKDHELRKFLRSRRPNCLMATTLAVHGLNRRHIVHKRYKMVADFNRDQLRNCSFNYNTTQS